MKLWRAIVILWRACLSYPSDVGGFRECLAWERGFMAGSLGRPVQVNPYRLRSERWKAWEHGHFNGRTETKRSTDA